MSSCPGQLVALSMSPPPPEGKTNLRFEPAPARKSLLAFHVIARTYQFIQQGHRNHEDPLGVAQASFVLKPMGHYIGDLLSTELCVTKYVLGQMYGMVGQTSTSTREMET